MDLLYSFIDKHGFWTSSITELAKESMPESVASTLIHSTPPKSPPGPLKAWAWDSETSEWVERASFKGHFWYNPERTQDRFCAKEHDDTPPSGWLYLPPGTEIELALAEVKEKQWGAIKARRNAVEFGSFAWDGLVFDCDSTSQSRIQGVVQMARLAKDAGDSTFSIDWTLANNSTHTLSADEMISVGMAMGQHISAAHAKARLLRSYIQAATTAEEVKAVVW